MVAGVKLFLAAGAVAVGVSAGLPQPASFQAALPASGAQEPQPPAQEPAEPQNPKPPESKPADERVTGKVLDRDGKAVERAEVRFTGRKKGTVFTDSRGEFAFRGPAGAYAITVKAGARQQNFDATIEEHQLKPSTLVIEPEG
jgi:hypothetical protein